MSNAINVLHRAMLLHIDSNAADRLLVNLDNGQVDTRYLGSLPERAQITWCQAYLTQQLTNHPVAQQLVMGSLNAIDTLGQLESVLANELIGILEQYDLPDTRIAPPR